MSLRLMGEQEFYRWRRSNGLKNRTWRFAVTVRTPVQRIDWYVDTLLVPVESMSEAVIRVTQTVFEPDAVNAFRKRHGVDDELGATPALAVSGMNELRGLLKSAFSDSLDFGLFMVPARFALAADHDEWTRIFAVQKAELERMIAPIAEGGVEIVEPVHKLTAMPRSGPTM